MNFGDDVIQSGSSRKIITRSGKCVTRTADAGISASGAGVSVTSVAQSQPPAPTRPPKARRGVNVSGLEFGWHNKLFSNLHLGTMNGGAEGEPNFVANSE